MGLTVLVTGASGFVGRALLPVLAADPAVGRVVGWCRRPRAGLVAVPLTDRAASARALAALAPDVVVHLAARAGEHGTDGAALDAVNVHGIDGLCDALGTGRLVAASTGYVYGPTSRPAREDDPLAPVGAYAGSKARMEARLHRRVAPDQLRILRPFNHSGPGQGPRYALPAFARRLVALRAGRTAAVPTGDLGAVRDVGDVRDLARAIAAAATAPSWPAVCNVCTGEGHRMGALLQRMAARAGLPAPVPTAPSGPPSALPASVGDPHRLWATGHRPRHDLDALLDALVAEAETALA